MTQFLVCSYWPDATRGIKLLLLKTKVILAFQQVVKENCKSSPVESYDQISVLKGGKGGLSLPLANSRHQVPDKLCQVSFAA